MEKNYEFRKRLLSVHKPNRATADAGKITNGITVDGSFSIVYPSDAGRVLSGAAHDLRDYFEISMNVYLTVRPEACITSREARGRIVITVDKALESGTFTVKAGNGGIVITSSDERMAAQGVYYLEDMMNLNECPAVSEGTVSRRRSFSPRMVHSGYSLDVYPDVYLSKIAHMGIDAILVFVKGVDLTPRGYLDFNELIYRAAGFGIDVYAYSYMQSQKHPDEPDAADYYRSTYGRLLEKCPGFKGVVFVGESIEFPSHDERTTGHSHRLPRAPGDKRPSPGWFPCRDYPQWVELVHSIIKEKSPECEFVFWSYNWGRASVGPRLELLRSLPTDITLLVTYEMFERFKIKENVEMFCSDYTLSFEGPGGYFTSEAEEAKKRGIKLYAMSNAGGMTWDIGTVPYIPAPFQWKKRFDALKQSKEQYGLSGLMESHHYGFMPSFISELAKYSFYGGDDFDGYLQKLAVRDFSEAAADKVVEACRLFSRGICHCVPSHEDQYGPARVGPSYPLLFEKEYTFESEPFYSMGKNVICWPMYDYKHSAEQLEWETEEYGTMCRLFKEGGDIIESVISDIPENKYADARRFLCLVRFIEKTAQTVVNVKKWYVLKQLLQADRGNRTIIGNMKRLAENEIENARSALPFVDYDSRLGYEHCMGYMCDREHIEWKIKVTESVVREELV